VALPVGREGVVLLRRARDFASGKGVPRDGMGNLAIACSFSVDTGA
jgi:hypothetical protein